MGLMRSPPSGKLLKVRNSSKQLKVKKPKSSDWQSANIMSRNKCFVKLLKAVSTSKAEQRKTLESVIKPESTFTLLFRGGETQRLGLCNPEIVFIAHR